MLTETFRIDSLRLRNYRCFSACEVRLEPKLTVLVAENGRGKTTLLDALSAALEPVVDGLTGVRQWSGVGMGDVRVVRQEGAMMPVLPTEISATGIIDGEKQTWRLGRSGVTPHSRNSTRDLKTMRSRVRSMRSRLDSFASEQRELAPPLPLVAYYGTGRLWAPQRLTRGRLQRDLSALGRLSGYQDCLSSDSSFKTFVAWYGDMAHAARSSTSFAARPGEQPVLLLAAVRQATATVLEPTGWTVLDWDYPPTSPNGSPPRGGRLVVEHEDHGRHSLSQLSDGVRNMIALVADVAHRCARLNPQFGEDAPRRTPGVLLVDEVDMHLHPRWQQEVIRSLQKAFPLIQLVVTTHSPQVLSTVDSESIRMISVDEAGVGRLARPDYQTRGVESADVLARVMGVHGVPKIEEAEWLSRYRALLQEGAEESVEARQLWPQIVAHFGEVHPVMDEVRTLRRLHAFKRASGLVGPESD